MIEADDAALGRMLRNQAVRIDGSNPAVESTQADLQRQLANSSVVQMRPRVQPAEFIAHLAARGVTLTATPIGDIVARPASLLTEPDRAVLRELKAAIVAALAGDAETI